MGTKKLPGFMAIFKQTWSAAKWVITTKVAILMVVGGLLIDGVVRNFATINSEYYRVIEGSNLHLWIYCGWIGDTWGLFATPFRVIWWAPTPRLLILC